MFLFLLEAIKRNPIMAIIITNALICFYRNNRKWTDIDKLAAHFVQVTVGRRNVPKGRLWNPMEKSK
jgi:hypothetical protein